MDYYSDDRKIGFSSGSTKLVSLRLNLMNINQETQKWAMLLHFSVLASWVVPFAGFILPIVIWQFKKKELPQIDIHGKIVMNWIVSQIIYVPVLIILIPYLGIISILLLIIIGLTNIIFPILGGIKAGNGEIWRYPFSIRFLK